MVGTLLTGEVVVGNHQFPVEVGVDGTYYCVRCRLPVDHWCGGCGLPADYCHHDSQPCRCRNSAAQSILVKMYEDWVDANERRQLDGWFVPAKRD